MKLVISALIAAVATHAISLPPEVSAFTGLSPQQLRGLMPTNHPVLRAACAVNDTSDGVFTGPSTPDHEGILKRNSFVRREGTKLTLLGQDFRFVGSNIYWLGLDENVIPDPAYPSKTRVLEAFADVSVMKGTTVRGHTLGISVGNPLSVEPDLDVFNDDAYEPIDFAIAAARIYGLKLLIPLVDNYNYYHGGKYQFIAWHNISFEGTGSNITPPDVGAFFYNTTEIVDSFKRYITNHLNHVNQYTGIALKDDPTILAWESGNELSGARFGDGPAPAAWTHEIGTLVKSLAPNQLFMDGSYGIFPETLVNEVVDIFGDHFYPPNITRLTQGMDLVTAAGRNYVAGEYDWTGLNGGDDLSTFLSTIHRASVKPGDAFWSLFGHDDACCNYVEHTDGESFYYLRQDNGTLANAPADIFLERGKVLVAHAAEMAGEAAPERMPAVACPQTAFPPDLVPPGFPI
ncbi:glycoside hydrolase [Amylostereum chailletii]|nr:glycoside hydrolase [Amylostereum chailletii]